MSNALASKRATRSKEMSVEWYTPPWLMSAIEDFLGPDYYDPCPARNGRTMSENGLSRSWAGMRVYCNPPYGRSISTWISKAMTEPVEEIILLLPASTGAKWFRPLALHSVCFIEGRVQYNKPGNNGKTDNAPHWSMLIYRGGRHHDFAPHFAEIGPTFMQVYRRHLHDLWAS